MDNMQEKIAQRAYELFQARGGQHGYHMADWLQAEKEIRGAAVAPQSKVKSSPKPSPAPVKSASPLPETGVVAVPREIVIARTGRCR